MTCSKIDSRRDFMVRGIGLKEEQLGTDAAGTVVAVGAKVTHVKEGDRVAIFAPGAYCTRIRTHQGLITKIPEDMTLGEAATLPSLLLSAYHLIFHLCRLSSRDSILITNADSRKFTSYKFLTSEY